MTQPAAPIKFYSMHLSGNAHRVLLTLRALDLPFELIEVNLRAKEQKSEAFLQMNPFGQVPVIDDNGTIIWDSIGIMTYLALRYDDGRLLPRDPAQFGQIMAWLGKTSGPIAYGMATARRINLFNAPADIDTAHAIAHDFLHVMNEHLEGRAWLVGGTVTLADLACYAYVAHAPEGGVDLKGFGNVSGWLAQVEALPFFAAMPRAKVGLWAE
ncbi:glutathione S-transferase family protein [Asticcacaulis sp.]|uniref:glutathione S-transferase family protein n=1 Tax=Asticcacaulis sp. TaxID=1872648 RepID=UPI003F7BEFAF